MGDAAKTTSRVPPAVLFILCSIFFERYTSGGIAGEKVSSEIGERNKMSWKISIHSNNVFVFQPQAGL